jgi:hypothetical protein
MYRYHHGTDSEKVEVFLMADISLKTGGSSGVSGLKDWPTSRCSIIFFCKRQGFS